MPLVGEPTGTTVFGLNAHLMRSSIGGAATVPLTSVPTWWRNWSRVQLEVLVLTRLQMESASLALESYSLVGVVEVVLVGEPFQNDGAFNWVHCEVKWQPLQLVSCPPGVWLRPLPA